MSGSLPSHLRPVSVTFALAGALVPMLKGTAGPVGVELGVRAGVPPSWRPTRPMAGWLMTYGKLLADGTVQPTVDREHQTIEAARELGHVDWQAYVKDGVWNDTHNDDVIVGVPHTLSWHGPDSPLAQAHGKIGFFTTGHLFDRGDPVSYEPFLSKGEAPSFGRADHFHRLATLLDGAVAPIGISAQGKMLLSPCRKRVLYARIEKAAVCETPMNPDATLEPMSFAFLGKGTVSEALDPCASCSCPAGGCKLAMRKATPGGLSYAGSSFTSPVVPEDLENVSRTAAERVRGLAARLAAYYGCTEEEAVKLIKKWVAERRARDSDTDPLTPIL